MSSIPSKKKLVIFMSVAMLLVLLCSFLGGCSNKLRATNRAESRLPKIVVGVDDYPPFNFPDENGEPMGIDIELAKEAFDRLGYHPVFEKIDWEDKDELLKRGTIDCIWSSFSIKGREHKYKWAGPYMVSRQVVAVDANSGIYKLQDLEGKAIAVQTTTKPEEIFLRKAETSAGKVPRLRKIYSLEYRDLIYAMLGKGYVDAVAAHESAILQYNKDFGTDYRILDEPLVVTGLGVAFAPEDDRGIAEKLDEVLQKMHKDGTTKKIIEKYLDDAERYLEVDSLGN